MITVFGDSHVSVLAGAARNHPEQQLRMLDSNGINWAAFEIHKSGEKLRLISKKVDNVKPFDITLAPDGPHYFSSILHSAPFYRDPSWKTFCPWALSHENPGMIPLPDSALELWADRESANKFELLEAMKTGGFDISVVEPPKPLGRTPKLHGIEADVLRYVSDHARTYLIGKIQKLGIDVVRAPDESYEDGYTKPDYSSYNEKDPHHGGKKFSETMLNAIVHDAEGRLSMKSETNSKSSS